LVASNSDLAYSDWQHITQNEGGGIKLGEIRTLRLENVNSDPQIAVISGFWCPPAALLYRRSLVRKVGGWNRNLPIIQDARFLQDAMFCQAKHVYVPGVGAYYRVHSGLRLSQSYPQAFLKDCLRNVIDLEQIWRSRNEFTLAREEATLAVLSQIARSAFPLDRTTFDEALQHIYRLRSDWVPKRPRALAFLSRLIGYRRAEAVAQLYRSCKRVNRKL
jgi:hypothetical protein